VTTSAVTTGGTDTSSPVPTSLGVPTSMDWALIGKSVFGRIDPLGPAAMRTPCQTTPAAASSLPDIGGRGAPTSPSTQHRSRGMLAGLAAGDTDVDQDFDRTIDLVHRAHDGDRAALELLIGRYYERVRRIVRLRLGAALRTRVDSGDILQEVFMEAVKHFDRFEMRDDASLIHWMSCMVENRIRDAADYFGAAKRDAGREVPLAGDSTELDRELTAGGLLPADSAHRQDQITRLEAAIERLAPADRELILLRDYAGLSWERIAELTGRPTPDAARMAHVEAVKRLGRLLGE
jgi:RNA polymerase sigma-70 factor (ECF subfamily)